MIDKASKLSGRQNRLVMMSKALTKTITLLALSVIRYFYVTLKLHFQ